MLRIYEFEDRNTTWSSGFQSLHIPKNIPKNIWQITFYHSYSNTCFSICSFHSTVPINFTPEACAAWQTPKAQRWLIEMAKTNLWHKQFNYTGAPCQTIIRKHQGGLWRGKGDQKGISQPRLGTPPCFVVVHLFQMMSGGKIEKGLGVTGNRGRILKEQGNWLVARACLSYPFSSWVYKVSTAKCMPGSVKLHLIVLTSLFCQ